MTSPSTDRRRGLTSGTGLKTPVRAATTGPVTLSGLQTVDTVVLADGDDVLVKDQVNTAQNGIYTASTGSWTRRYDSNGNMDLVRGTIVGVTDGSQAGSFFGLYGTNPIYPGTTPHLWILAANMSSSTASFIGAGAGAVSYDLQSRGRLEVWSRDYGHVPGASAAVNDAALLAAMAYVYSIGGGTVRIAAGTYLHDTVAFNWSANNSVNLRGAGKTNTIFQKSGTDASPVLDFSADLSTLAIYSEFSDFYILGNATYDVNGYVNADGTSPGLRTTLCSRFVLRNLFIQGNLVGWDNVGGEVFQTYDVDLMRNTTNYKQRKSGSIYANMIAFNGGANAFAKTWGLDLGDGSDLVYNKVDFENNGTSNSLPCGSVYLDPTLDDEVGAGSVSTVYFSDCWFEGDWGTTVKCGTVAGLMLKFKNIKWASSHSGVCIDAGAISMMSFDNCETSDTITIAVGTITNMTNCTFAALTNNGTDQVYNACQINGTVIPWKVIVSGVNNNIDTYGILNVGINGIKTSDTKLLESAVALTDGSSSKTPTMGTNSPVTGAPTKWLKIIDNGSTRWIPTWS